MLGGDFLSRLNVPSCGHFQGVDQRDKYPEGAAPYVRGEACNTAFTYGYDSVTQMQETKASLCKISAA